MVIKKSPVLAHRGKIKKVGTADKAATTQAAYVVKN